MLESIEKKSGSGMNASAQVSPRKSRAVGKGDRITKILDITGITFQDDLRVPRYGSFFDYEMVPENVLAEPAFLFRPNIARGRKFKLRFRIADTKVVFATDGGMVRCRSIRSRRYGRPPAGFVSARPLEEVEGGSRGCELVWKPSAMKAPITPLRIVCRRVNQSPRDADGITVTFIRHLNRNGAIGGKEDPRQPDFRIKVRGPVDGRLIYDIFNPAPTLPRAVELEPAFRVRRGERLAFEIDVSCLKPPLTFEAGVPDDDHLVYLPDMSVRPNELLRTLDPNGEQNRCCLEWRRESELGSVSSFSLATGKIGPSGVFAPAGMDIDPVVVHDPDIPSKTKR